MSRGDNQPVPLVWLILVAILIAVFVFQLAEAGIVPVATVTAIETRVDGLETLHGKDIVRVESKAELIAQILMED